MSTPEAAAPYRTLPAAQVGDPTAPLRWLLADLFLVGAAGILGGAPKTGKSFFALELAVAVASATAAAGRFATTTPGPVLLCAAEDPPAVVVQRLAALAAARAQALPTLPVEVIVELLRGIGKRRILDRPPESATGGVARSFACGLGHATSIARPFETDDLGVMNDAVDERDDGGGVREDRRPIAKG